MSRPWNGSLIKVCSLVTFKIDWESSLSTKWILAGNTINNKIISPYEANFLVFLKANNNPKTTSIKPVK